MLKRNIIARKYVIKINTKYKWIKKLILNIRIKSILKVIRIRLIERKNLEFENGIR